MKCSMITVRPFNRSDDNVFIGRLKYVLRHRKQQRQKPT